MDEMEAHTDKREASTNEKRYAQLGREACTAARERAQVARRMHTHGKGVHT
jgi:hypothetical protein